MIKTDLIQNNMLTSCDKPIQNNMLTSCDKPHRSYTKYHVHFM